MNRNLTVLDEYNRNKINKQNTTPKSNNIACPDCGNELQDTSDSILSAHPIKVCVQCPKCGYKGCRY
jgi:uncharacterized protein with PIN domain|tara:strand:+ start:384 stop:584 length:201 start_codon:yes stop_codon:yes gene_type:complete